MFSFLSLGAFLCLAPLATALTIESNSLHTQGFLDPNGISTPTPRLSWRLLGELRNETQVSYQVQAASSRQGFHHPDLWDTGKVTTANISVLYVGEPLTSRSLVYWRIRAWDAQDHASDWSDIASSNLVSSMLRTGQPSGSPTLILRSEIPLSPFLRKTSRRPAIRARLACTFWAWVCSRLF
jgi:hypothetical protein